MGRPFGPMIYGPDRLVLTLTRERKRPRRLGSIANSRHGLPAGAPTVSIMNPDLQNRSRSAGGGGRSVHFTLSFEDEVSTPGCSLGPAIVAGSSTFEFRPLGTEPERQRRDPYQPGATRPRRQVKIKATRAASPSHASLTYERDQQHLALSLPVNSRSVAKAGWLYGLGMTGSTSADG